MNSKSKIKIAFLVPDLSGGGAEKIAITFLHRLDRELFEPSLILCSKTGIHLDSVPKDVPVHSLRKNSAFSFPMLIWRFRKHLQQYKPDIVVSFLWYADVIQLLAKLGLKTKTICCFHTVPISISKERFGTLKYLFLKQLYKLADRILAVSQSVANDIDHSLLNGKKGKTFVQYNPFEINQLVAKSQLPESTWNASDKGKIVFVGRLEIVKGPDRLLKALAKIPSDINWHAKFVGDGSMKSQLIYEAKKLKIFNRISFEGFVSNPFPTIKHADILVLTSRFEAYPSVIVEAMLLNTPVVAYNCPSGPSEIITANNGVLVESGNSESLKDAIVDLLKNREKAASLAANGPDSVKHLSAESATKMLEAHITEVVLKND
ncbi:glycosyltransferase [Aliiglaciecola lipolytica]|uniref:Glycosyltransferase n=1 Tax=Aliiglaciecola lipolytica E3 TaxID=1127673 RepID=K6WZ37_9ALTE|nr:glycosyltransferase [Aliiglaciecola lipolytica]GAC13714.1 hypothetical protein GLIP_1072 [Aliiglaciecola lipolytica E3]